MSLLPRVAITATARSGCCWRCAGAAAAAAGRANPTLPRRRLFATTARRRMPPEYTAYTLPRNKDLLPVDLPRNTDAGESSITLESPRPARPRRDVVVAEPPDGLAESEKAGATAAPQPRQHDSTPQPPSPKPALPPHPSAAAAQTAAPQPKRRRALRPLRAAVTLSPAAASQLRALMDGPEPRMIRIGVRNKGCSGLAYHLEYVAEKDKGKLDEVVEQDGVRVLVEGRALMSVVGSEMDWVEDRLSARFVFRNPNIKEMCGCGESFMV